MTYSVVLDSSNSYLVPSDNGMSFTNACMEVINYAIEAGCDIQQELFETLLSEGEDSKDTFGLIRAQ